MRERNSKWTLCQDLSTSRVCLSSLTTLRTCSLSISWALINITLARTKQLFNLCKISLQHFVNWTNIYTYHAHTIYILITPAWSTLQYIALESYYFKLFLKHQVFNMTLLLLYMLFRIWVHIKNTMKALQYLSSCIKTLTLLNFKYVELHQTTMFSPISLHLYTL